MVEIHLYGKLRRYAPDPAPNGESVVRLELHEGETLADLLARVGIEQDEIYHVFLNGTLLATHNRMAPWLGYQQTRPSVWEWDLDIPLSKGDRLGLFGRDMASLVV